MEEVKTKKWLENKLETETQTAYDMELYMYTEWFFNHVHPISPCIIHEFDFFPWTII